MTQLLNPSVSSGDAHDVDAKEANLLDFYILIYRHKWLLCCVALGGMLLATGIAVLLQPNYKAVIVISPSSDNSISSRLGGSGGSALSQFGGLASLAGLSLGDSSKKEESLEILQSEALTEKYIADNNLLPTLFADKWDADRKQWRDEGTNKIPTLWKANEFFKKKIRSVTTDSKTGLVNMTITWKDPALAAKWANDLVRMTNDYTRAKAIRESDRNIEYLNEQAAKTDVTTVKQAIYSLLQTEISKGMLAKGTDEYAFKILDPARPPEKASSPLIPLWSIGGFFIGTLFGLCIVILRTARTN